MRLGTSDTSPNSTDNDQHPRIYPRRATDIRTSYDLHSHKLKCQQICTHFNTNCKQISLKIECFVERNERLQMNISPLPDRLVTEEVKIVSDTITVTRERAALAICRCF